MSVLRALIALVALALMASGGRLFVEGIRAPGLYLLISGAVILAGMLFERWRYRVPGTQAPAGWQRTAERFVDPESGRTLTVYYDPASGERRYVGEEPAHGGSDRGGGDQAR